jgi:hypothetical protein
MSTNTQTKNLIDSKMPIVRVLLAETNLSEIALIRMGLIDLPQILMTTVKSCDQLLETIATEKPQLVLLGNIDVVNYFAICRECHNIRENLPVILLSNQTIINDSFRETVQSYGITDIIGSSDFDKLNKLFSTLVVNPESITTLDTKAMVTGRMVLLGLEEIVAASNNYFGPLAQGNYWRKAHARALDTYPLLQNWSADHFSKITCEESILDLKLAGADIQDLRIWVRFFIEECERIIVDFRTILENAHLSTTAQDLLTKSP